MTSNVSGSDFSPPESGFAARISKLATFARSEAFTVAVNCDELTKFVLKARPFNWTTELAKKPEPFTFNKIPELPSTTRLGESEESDGARLAGIAMPVMGKINGADFPPPNGGFTTMTTNIPAAAAISCKVKLTVNFELLTNVAVRLDPLMRTSASLTKFAPLMVKV